MAFQFKMLVLFFFMDLRKSWPIVMNFVQCLLSLCKVGAWWLPEMGMVCAKGCESGTVLRAVCVRVCCRIPAKTRERALGKFLLSSLFGK